jgi:hypothetical protein
MAYKVDRSDGRLHLSTCAHTAAMLLEGAGRWCTTCGALGRESKAAGGLVWVSPARAQLLRKAVEIVRDVVALVSTTAGAVLDAARSEEAERAACSIWEGEEREKTARAEAYPAPGTVAEAAARATAGAVARVHHHVEAVRAAGGGVAVVPSCGAALGLGLACDLPSGHAGPCLLMP